jgi:hypothetical protein
VSAKMVAAPLASARPGSHLRWWLEPPELPSAH